MTREEQILDFITNTLLPGTAVPQDPAADLMASEAVDSVAMMEMIVWLEETFNITIDAEDLTPENFSTVNAMVAYIEKASA